MGHCSLTETNRQRTKKWLFSKFSLLLHICLSRRNFFVFTKISYLQPFREIMGGQRIRKFSAKMTPQAKKMTFFFLLLHIYTSRRNFFVFIKISYLQPFREIMGGQEKSVTSNDERRRRQTNDNKQRRTTLTIIIPRQDSQNPRANKHSIVDIDISFLLLCA